MNSGRKAVRTGGPMQIGGVGSEHNNNMHHVSSCLHNHEGTMKTGASKSSAASSVPSVPEISKQPEAKFSLSAWLADPLGNAKKLFGRIWRGGDGNGSGNAVNGSALNSAAEKAAAISQETLTQSAEESFAAAADTGSSPTGQQRQNAENATNVIHAPQMAAASAAVPQPRTIQNNPYFSTIEDTNTQQQAVWQKIRVRFQSITGFLTKKFTFSGRNSFQAGQEQGQHKEDLRKHSRYHEDNLEIDCILTDDSYLLDSYDRKGEYSQLSTKK